MKNTTLKNILGLLLIYIFFLTYLNSSSGTWGDDSDGYFLGSYYLNNGKISPIDSDLITHFKDKGYNREELKFLIPNRYSLNVDYSLNYRYPPGISYYITFFTTIYPDSLGYNFFVGIISIVNLILFYALLCILFASNKNNIVIAFITTFALGMTSLYLQYSMAQPMRELPIMLLNSIILILYFKFWKYGKTAYLLFALFVAAISLYVRHTNIFIFIIFIPLIKNVYFNNQFDKKKIKEYFLYITLLGLILMPLLIFNFQNTSNLFKPQSYDDHINAIQIKNIYDNGGKYRPGEGGLFLYSNYIVSIKSLLFIALGIVFLYKQKYLYIILYPILTLLLFSMWPNPYPRYILPVIPFIYLLIASSVVYVLDAKYIKTSIKTLFAIFFLVLLLPNTLIAFNENFLSGKNYHKSLSVQDYENITSLRKYQGIVLLDSSLYNQQGFLQFVNKNQIIIKQPIKNITIIHLKEINSNIYLLTDKKKDKNILEQLLVKKRIYYLYEVN
ncbi:MAG: hypothetical protein ACOC16_03120 [Nanoarchaeota archaeon]